MLDSSFESSVTLWIKELKEGDDAAAQQLWDAFFPNWLPRPTARWAMRPDESLTRKM